MKIAFYNAKPYEIDFFEKANSEHEITYIEEHLSVDSVALSKEHEAIVVFVNDHVNTQIIEQLAKNGVKLIALRCAGFNNVDLKTCKKHKITVVRVPAYSPHAVAEFATALILTLNRKTHHAHAHVKEHNFSLHGLLGFDLHGKTVGIIGTGKIGEIFANIMQGFGCKVIAYDPAENTPLNYVSLVQLYQHADIISLHCPLNKDTYHMINQAAIAKMKHGVMLINTGRGALIHTHNVIDGLKSEKIGYLGLDVYEEEEQLFFEDLSTQIINDDDLARLQFYPNVLITSHQAFFTHEAMENIANTTIGNINAFENGDTLDNLVG